MVHKKYHEKIISKHFIPTGHDVSGARFVETWTLSEQIIKKLNSILPICSVDIRKKYDDNLPSYLTKNLLKNPEKAVNYTIFDITRSFRQNATSTENYYLTNENIGSDDVMFFAWENGHE